MHFHAYHSYVELHVLDITTIDLDAQESGLEGKKALEQRNNKRWKMEENLFAYMPGEDTASQMFIKHHVACERIISQNDDRSTASASQSACHALPWNAHMAVATTPLSNWDHVHISNTQTDAAEHGSISQDTPWW